jgi:hypothetical protein
MREKIKEGPRQVERVLCNKEIRLKIVEIETFSLGPVFLCKQVMQ